MPSQPTNLTLDQGITFAFSVVWKDSTGTAKDLTGYNARLTNPRVPFYLTET